ncbi:methionine aminopeptidase [Microstroma glucosiphilum]|uniref:Methionine aminopeptidase n=1 Tax=Pseudomicrostroma glucosiphilum TaxID=1684307 RepID=A0A316U6R9_9BASI|nr:methionine aminopeptidase [Pseudomicrostroma glucosiphilum]PWN20929.1 methionine aminopeptidase [Pseudomicrostroma glucosiphilum]
MSSRNIKINNEEETAGVRKAATLAREVLMLARDAIKVGVTTDEIDKIVFREAIKRDCYPSPLNYHGYPKSVCTSVNECVCHGIPDKRPLQGSDIINIDVTLYHKGYHGDLNGTWPVDPALHPADAPSSKLIRVARECLDKAIAICGPGVPYGEVGAVIQPHAEANGFGVVKNYTGHGVGKVFHGAPTIFHHKTKKSRGIMEIGHIFTIEPMISASPPPVGCGDLSWPDDWTVTTTDGAYSAAAEETLVITPHGVEILSAEGGPKVLDTREERARRGLLRESEKRQWEEEQAGNAGAQEGREDGKRVKV